MALRKGLSEFECYKEKERQVKEKRSMKDMELHPAHDSFNSKGDKKTVESFQQVFDSTSLQCDSS